MFKKNELKVEFLCRPEEEGAYPEPKPARAFLPDWYKAMPPISNADTMEFPVGTAKKCVPFLDAMSAGYIIPLPISLRVIADEGDNTHFSWLDGEDKPIGEHSMAQLPNAPGSGPIFKFMVPWSIVLPKGYSAIFTHPLNHSEELFKIYDGIVDLDSYNHPVNFPFRWNARPFDGVIHAGTPIAQVIPFKREEWSMGVRGQTEEERKGSIRTQKQLSSRGIDAYKKLFWSKKRY